MAAPATQPAPASGDAPAPAQPQESAQAAETAETSVFEEFLRSKTMTMDWFGLGPDMRDHGINLQWFWNNHFFSVMGGGLETGGPKHSSTYDALLSLDFEKMGLIKGGEMLVHARQQWGNNVNRWTGATQQVHDDPDGDRSIYVDQLWYRQSFLDKKVALQVGYLDYQTIVDRNVYANTEDKQFMNEALDNNPLFPTASATGLGATLTIQPCEWYSLLIGAGDAQRLPLYKPGFSTTFHDEAWFLGYMEHHLRLKIQTDRGPLTGNYRFGLIYDPVPRTVIEKPRENRATDRRGDDYGFYTSFDQMLYRENDKDDQGLGAFFRYAFRHRDLYRYNQFWSTGLVYTGLIPTRDKDVLGFAVAQLLDSNLYRRYVNPLSENETYYELYYAIEITPWLVLTPDIQYIDNPGGNGSISHAWAGGLRTRVTF